MLIAAMLTALLINTAVAVSKDKIGQGDVIDLTDSKPEEGIVFAVCIFAVGEDGTRYLVDHRHATDMSECIRKRREPVNNIII